MNNLGLAHLFNENFDKAEAMFNQAIEINDNYSLAYDNRAYLRYLKKDFTGAIQDYNKEIELTPDYYLAYINRGRTYAAMQNYTAAIADFDFVIKHDTLLMNALTNRAYAYYYAGNIDSAKRNFVKLTQDFPENLSVWQNMSWFYKENNDFDKSIEAMLEIIKINDEYEPVYANLGILYINLKKFELAKYYLNIGLSLNSDNPEILYLLAEVYRLTNNLQKACDFYEKSSSFNHNSARNAYNTYCNN
jgi:tetratricopeptide (TPR) repeat protein